jgi:biofilm protein TabA
MILDKLSKLGTYSGISANMNTAIEYLLSNDIRILSDGSYPIEGDNVIVNVMSYETKKVAAAAFEAHRKYIDIQILIQGEELCYYSPLQDLVASSPFDEQKDIGFYTGHDGVFFPLTLDNFAIFFPHDAHMPSCEFHGKDKIRKVVIKIAI